MLDQPLDGLPLTIFFILACLVVAAPLEVGYRFGKRQRNKRGDEEKDSSMGVVVGAILGLLGFMLAFTFGMAASRFEARQQAVLDEANSIGTTYLRTDILPEPHRTSIRKLLREYVDVRVHRAQSDLTADDIRKAVARSEEILSDIWSQSMKATQPNPSAMTNLYIVSLNETIDLHAKRLHVGVRTRIPLTIWLGLAGVAIVGLASTGYQWGLSTARRSIVMLGLILAFAGVLTLIADLDQPKAGTLRTTQAPLIDLQKSME